MQKGWKMQRLIITLMNMYDADPTLLDQLALPSAINRDDFIGRLMLDIGEQEVCITNPRIMKMGIGVWSRGRLPIWEKLINVQDLEYNPIWNVDGTVTHTGSRSDERQYDRDRTEDTSIDETTTGYISADNSELWSNDTKTETGREESISEKIGDTESSSGNDQWSERRTGNIGVTTTQKMLNEEVEFWSAYDIIRYIINDFAKEFCLLVY